MDNMWVIPLTMESLNYREIIADEVLCEDKENHKFMPSSDTDILHEKKHSNGYGNPHLTYTLSEGKMLC